MEFIMDNGKPIYRQIVEQILLKIRTGELKAGEKLPTERDLAKQLYIARGTVKRAYKELADNNIIEIVQGSGSYVYAEKKLYDGERRKLAISVIDEVLDKLDLWDISIDEAEVLIRMCIARKQRGAKPVRGAIIDCNPESLYIFRRQLSYIPNIAFSAIAVDMVIMDSDPAALLADYDLLLTTQTHYGQVSECLGENCGKLFQVSIALSRQSIVSISTLPERSSIGIVCTSNKFSNLICDELSMFRAASGPLPVNFDRSTDSILSFISRYDTIIIAPDSIILDPGFSDPRLSAFLDTGGKLIPFDYMLDKGSLIYVEELASRVMREKYNII